MIASTVTVVDRVNVAVELAPGAELASQTHRDPLRPELEQPDVRRDLPVEVVRGRRGSGGVRGHDPRPRGAPDHVALLEHGLERPELAAEGLYTGVQIPGILNGIPGSQECFH